MAYPRRSVIDTNVLVVANRAAPHASNDCVASAAEFLHYTLEVGVVILDHGGEIFSEYRRHCSYRGQPGVGDLFFLHLHRTQADPRRVQKVEIHRQADGTYSEIPGVLRNMDKGDMKFVAAAVADDRRAVIVNCCDGDWKEIADALAEARVSVLELCEHE